MAKKYIQGDVIFTSVESLPAGKKTSPDKQILELTGETGNVHSLKQVKVVEIDYNQFVVTPEHTTIMTHPEHPPLYLPPLLVARVSRVRSVTPMLD